MQGTKNYVDLPIMQNNSNIRGILGEEIKNVLENHTYTSSFNQQYKELKEKIRPSELENTWKTIDQALNSCREVIMNQRGSHQFSKKPKRSQSLDTMSIRSVSCRSSLSSLKSLSLDDGELKGEISDTDDNSASLPSTMVCNSRLHVLYYVEWLFHSEIKAGFVSLKDFLYKISKHF